MKKHFIQEGLFAAGQMSPPKTPSGEFYFSANHLKATAQEYTENNFSGPDIQKCNQVKLMSSIVWSTYRQA